MLRLRSGESGPALVDPSAVATKKLSTEPLVKLRPVIVKLPPTRIMPGTDVITGWPGIGVGVGLGGTGTGVMAAHSGGVGVGVGVRVAV